MTRADDAILELLHEAGIAANPATIAYNIDYDRSYVSRRCRTLSDHGLAERVDEAKAMYQITKIGAQYLSGSIQKSDLEPDSGLDPP